MISNFLPLGNLIYCMRILHIHMIELINSNEWLSKLGAFSSISSYLLLVFSRTSHKRATRSYAKKFSISFNFFQLLFYILLPPLCCCCRYFTLLKNAVCKFIFITTYFIYDARLLHNVCQKVFFLWKI